MILQQKPSDYSDGFSLSKSVHMLYETVPSRIRMVRRISLRISTLPRLSVPLTIHVAFILYLYPYILVALLLFVRIYGLIQTVSKLFKQLKHSETFRIARAETCIIKEIYHLGISF